MTPQGERSRGHTPRLLFCFFCAWSSGCSSAPAPAPGPAEPVAATFTATQATRGQEVFASVCSTCHGRTEFSGPIFAITWRAEPVGSLFEHISTAMPQDRPGSLSPQRYVDVVAYILQLNGIQPGERELPPDPALLGRMEW
jgi:mono/diheme cytochrome c family protein